MSSLSLHTRRDAQRTVIALVGDLDLATVPELRAKGLAELDEPTCAALVLDLAELTFVDSTGLGCWIELHNRADAIGKTVTLDAVPPATRRTVVISGLGELFGVEG